MKNFLLGILIFCFAGVDAQNVSDFQYIIVPDQFSSFEPNEYKLNYHLGRLLKNKNYTVLSQNQREWPQEVFDNPCLAVTVDGVKGKYVLKLKMNMIFTDCEGKEIADYRGISGIKEFERGYQEAMRKAIGLLPASHPQTLAYNPPAKAQTPATTEITKEAPVSPEVTETAAVPVTPKEPIQESGIKKEIGSPAGFDFTSDNLTVSLIENKDGSLTMVEKTTSAPMAVLFPTTREGVYRVSINSAAGNYDTVAFYDGEILEIEYLKEGEEAPIRYKKAP